MEVRFWAATDTGRKRGHNEDNFLVDRALRLFVVCDGMGGHAAGEVASAAAIQSIQSTVAERGSELADGTEETILEILQKAVEEANRCVWEMAQRDESRQGMGTTCSLLTFVGTRGYITHVGDSRIYRLRDNGVEQLTDDHTLRNHLIEQGKLGEGEKMDRENPITRAVGVAEEVEVDTLSVDLAVGDRFVICSDGLTEYLDTPSVLEEVAGGEDLEVATQNCIDHANHSGGKDNVTTILAEVGRGEGVWDARQSSAIGRAIRELPEFAHLTVEEFGVLAEQFEFRKVETGRRLVDAEQRPGGLIVVAAGSIELSENQEVVDVVGAGESFALRALFGASPGGMVAEALEPSAVAYLSRQGFEQVLAESPQTAAKLSWNFLERSMGKLRHLDTAGFRHPEALGRTDRPTGDMKGAEGDEVGGNSSEDGDAERLVGILREAAEGGGDSPEDPSPGNRKDDRERAGEPSEQAAARETMQLESFDEDSTNRD